MQDSGVALSKEGYSLNWLGKSYARLLANENIRTRLIADTAHNQNPANANSQNLLIKGDNLEVLKHLLGAYSEQVKMIYIDPPYNTGSDGFVYQDDRKFSVEQLSNLAGIDEDEARRILTFTSSSSNSHSAWLTFMYPRLYLAKQLLRDDGVIFISIDDNEQAQLKVLCDEVFGEENFVGAFPRITKKAGKTTDTIAKNHDYVFVYQNSSDAKLNSLELSDDAYKHQDEHVEIRGQYKLSQTLDYGSIQYSASLDYEIRLDNFVFRPGNVSENEMAARQSRNPKSDFCWRWSKKLFDFGLANDFIVVKGTRIYTKTYQNAVISKNDKGYFVEQKTRGKSASTLDFIDNQYSNDNAKKSLAKIFPTKVIEYPKPAILVQKLTHLTTEKNDIVLDFFAGSGTTAHAVMQLNAEDGGNRQFICVQIDEATDPKSEAYKAGYKTIFDITQARISKAAAKIKAENPLFAGDIGFKVFATQPMFDKYLDTPESLTENLELFDVKTLSQPDRHSLMLTWALRDGIKLGARLTPVTLGGYTAYAAEKILYFVDPDISLNAVVALLEQLDNNPAFAPSRLVVLGYLLDSKTQREMTEAVKGYNNRKGIELTLDIRYN